MWKNYWTVHHERSRQKLQFLFVNCKLWWEAEFPRYSAADLAGVTCECLAVPVGVHSVHELPPIHDPRDGHHNSSDIEEAERDHSERADKRPTHEKETHGHHDNKDHDIHLRLLQRTTGLFPSHTLCGKTFPSQKPQAFVVFEKGPIHSAFSRIGLVEVAGIQPASRWFKSPESLQSTPLERTKSLLVEAVGVGHRHFSTS